MASSKVKEASSHSFASEKDMFLEWKKGVFELKVVGLRQATFLFSGWDWAQTDQDLTVWLQAHSVISKASNPSQDLETDCHCVVSSSGLASVCVMTSAAFAHC